ncbi:response regulator [Proteobacteria bacterium 005FR1]|nr:response regulator [Proteobacteria bacterium 005FR1]
MPSSSINESSADQREVSFLPSIGKSHLPFRAADRSAVLYALIIATLLTVTLADFQTGLGVAVWVLYIVPLCISLLTWNPYAPVAVAGVSTVFMITTFFTDHAGIDSNLAEVNRFLGGASLWVMALVGYFFISNKVAVRTEEWIQSRITELHELMATKKDLDALGSSVLRFVAEQLGACAGVIYIREKEGFTRFGAYGISGKGVPARITAEDGLIGQAVADRRTFVLKDIPGDYLSYGSAFGSAKPRHLLISPALYRREVTAVIELGFAQKKLGFMPERLLERIAESIAVSIRSTEHQERLATLLDQTRKQAEELRSQQEELRVSNEELEQQSKALLESQSELEQQQAELEQTNVQLEEQTQKLELQKDELERAKSELQLRARELEQASQYKSDFLANMSHELRTPLNSTLILAKLLADNEEGNLNEEQVRYAETIQSSGNDLLNLINDILDLSKIEAGHMHIEAHTLSLGKLLNNLSRTFEPMAEHKGLHFSADIHETCPRAIEVDPQRLEQIMKNLLSNAIKFTEEGEVRIEVKRAPRDRVAFSVTDTGIGVSEANQALIFEAFQQADGTTSRRFGGTGLGLSISRELARLLGGEISLESTPGEGSTFTVTIPEVYSPDAVQPKEAKKAELPASAERLPQARPQQRTEPKPQPKRARTPALEDDRERLTGDKHVILVIEDDLAFARILYDMVHELDFQCLIANSAEEGLATCLEYMPSAVVLDVGLPDQSGLTVLDRLKQSVQTRHIPVHVISVEDHTHTALSLGAIGYMLKPVKRDQVVQALRLMEDRLVRNVKRLLIVEDDDVQREGLKKLLSTPEVEIVGVGTAHDCLERLKHETFDCMVLDLNLPDDTGHSLLQTLSEEDAYAFPPVIVYTGKDISPAEEQALSRYSKSIIIKGAKSPERLIDEVTLFLHQVVADLPSTQQSLLKKAKNRDALIEGRRILVVEDDVRNVYALSSVLEPRGVQVEIARNGLEALNILERTSDDPDQQIDLVLMDVMMPEMDGLTATYKIRQMDAYKKVPIIMLTAKAMKGDQKRCLEAGANDYMAKPLDPEKLMSLIRVWMPRQ